MKASFESDERFESEEAKRLVDEALSRSGLTREAARDLLGEGYALAKGDYGVPGTWPTKTDRQRAAGVVARLLRRVERELGVPLGGVLGTSAKEVVTELLAK